MKIVILDGYTLNPGDISWEGVSQFGETIIYDRTDPQDVLDRIGDAEVVFTNKTILTKEHFAKLPNLKFIGVLATGYNVVDIEAAREHGIPVSNIPTYGTQSVAQFATALMLELCHRIGAHDASVKAGQWNVQPDFCYWLSPLVELSGKTLGIIGFGRIGQAFATVAQALGMYVLAHDSYRNPELESATLRYADLDELYANSDVISLHCPLFDNNRGMIDKMAIGKMKSSAFLINTSRGPLINETDLAQALNDGHLAGAALDVLSSEPPVPDNPLLSARNCITTPHIAWATREARQRMMTIAEQNLSAFVSGAPINIVND